MKVSEHVPALGLGWFMVSTLLDPWTPYELWHLSHTYVSNLCWGTFLRSAERTQSVAILKEGINF